MKISVSFLKSKYDLNTTIDKLNKSNCDYLHFDFMDNSMVKNKSISIKELKKCTLEKPLDVHLMVSKPSKYIKKIKDLNIEYITYHYNEDKNNKTYDLIKYLGYKIGIAIKPDEDIENYKDILDKFDLILVLGVNPGYGGQEFIENTLEKLKYLSEYREKNKLNYKISIDGGINAQTINLMKGIDIDIVISGSYICMSDDYDKSINILRG